METHIIVALSLTLLLLLLVTWKDMRARRKNELLIQKTLKALQTQVRQLENTQEDSFLHRHSQLRRQISELKNLMSALLQNNQRDVLDGIFRQEINVLSDVARHAEALEAEIFRLESVRRALADHDPYIAFRNPPHLPNDNPYWEALSRWIRAEKQWTCEKCGINLEDRKKDLHAHHILGRGFNSPQHLKVLCIACHVEEPGHEFMSEKHKARYAAFLRWKRR